MRSTLYALAIVLAASPSAAQPFAYVIQSDFSSSPVTCRFVPDACVTRLLTVDLEQGNVLHVERLESVATSVATFYRGGPLALTSDGRYLAWASGSLAFIDRHRAAYGNAPHPSGAPTTLRSVHAAPSGARFYSLVSESNVVQTPTSLALYNLAGESYHVPLETHASSLAISPDETTAFAGRNADVAIVNLATRTITNVIQFAGAGTGAMVLSRDGRRLFVVRASAVNEPVTYTLYAVDVATRTVLASVSYSRSPILLASGNGTGVWITDPNDQARRTIRELDGATLASVRALSLPEGFSAPATLALTHDNASLLVPTISNPGLHVIEIDSGRTTTIPLPIGSGERFTGVVALKPTDSCIYRVAPRQLNVGAGNQTFSIDVPAANGCSWSAANAAVWTTLESVAGTGSATVSGTVRPNYNATSRSATFTIALQSVTITQSGDAGAPGAPQAPAGLTARISAPQTVALSWAPPAIGPAPAQYVVEVGSLSGQRDILSAPVGLLTNVSGRISAGTYFIRVRAVNAAGAGPASNEVSILMPTGPPAPGAPHLLFERPGEVARLVWGYDPGVAYIGFSIEAGRSPGAADLGTLHVGGPPVHIPPGSVAPGAYYVRVRATSAGGISAPSPESVIVIGSCTAPPPVPLFSITQNVTQAFGQIRVQSQQPIDYFVIAVGTSSGGGELGTFIILTNNVQARLSRGRYYLRASTANACGTSTPSAEVAIDVP